MAHSIELLLDDGADAEIRRIWSELATTSVRPARGRPHITMTVAHRISGKVDPLLAPVSQRLPFRLVIGAPLLFGTGPFVLALLAVPNTELLSVHAQVNRVAAPHLQPAAADHTLPGRWTPHVTLARGVTSENIGSALAIVADLPALDAQVAGLRRWDGDQREEFVLAGRAC